MTSSARNEQTSADLAEAMPPFIVSAEVEDVARKVIAEHDTAFGWIQRDFKVAYLLKLGDKPSPDDEIDTVAKCVKAPALWSVLSSYDFAIWVKDCYWRIYPAAAREAIVAHELCHIDATDDEKPKVRKHDLEEFGQVASWYGPWDSGLRLIERALGTFRTEREAAQDSIDKALDELDGKTIEVGGTIAHISRGRKPKAE